MRLYFIENILNCANYYKHDDGRGQPLHFLHKIEFAVIQKKLLSAIYIKINILQKYLRYDHNCFNKGAS